MLSLKYMKTKKKEGKKMPTMFCLSFTLFLLRKKEKIGIGSYKKEKKMTEKIL